MSRKWVVNASPVILLSNIARVYLLESLCLELVIPAAVADEIHAGPARDAAQQWLENEGLISHVRPVFQQLLDAGLRIPLKFLKQR